MDILIVDDNAFQRRMLVRMLRDLGHTVREAPDGPAALQACASAPPDLLLSDLLMPGMDGFGVLERMGRDHPQVPVVVLSADIQEASRRRAQDLGARAFLNKPATPASLASVMQVLCPTP